jgi:hypothetical protein
MAKRTSKKTLSPEEEKQIILERLLADCRQCRRNSLPPAMHYAIGERVQRANPMIMIKIGTLAGTILQSTIPPKRTRPYQIT